SGPGIAGPYTNNAINIALIPGSSTPISINTVNDQLNTQYYIDNFGDTEHQADGLTTVLAAQAEVICGQTYHIKIVIGDASDGIYDSWVYLEGGSFQSNQLDLAYTAPNLSSPNGGMYEGCEPANLVFTRDGGLANAQTYTYTITGSAQQNVDFTIAAPTIVFPVGIAQVIVPITAIADGVLEGTEQFTFTLNESSCGAAPYTVDVFIQDLPDLIVTITDTTIQCGGQVSLTPQVSGGLGNYLVTWADGTQAATYVDNPTAPTNYVFTVTDTCGVAPVNGVAQVDFIQNPALSVNVGNDITATCLDELNIGSVVSGGFGNYNFNWTGNGGFLSSTDSVEFSTGVNVTVVLTVTDECGTQGSDALQVSIPAVPVIVQLGADISTTCLDVNTIAPTVSGGIGNYAYAWSAGGSTLGVSASLDYQTSNNATVQLQVTDECGNVGNDQLAVNVPPVPISVNLGADVVGLCTDAFDFQPIVSGGVGLYAYSWTSGANNLGSQSTLTTTFADDATLTLTVTDECNNSSNDALQVLIPPVAINVNAGPDIVSDCVTLNPLSAQASGGVGNLSFSWADDDGFFSSNPTPTYAAPQTVSVTVTASDECGNESSDQLIISIPPVPILLTTSPDTTICMNASAFLTGSATGGVGVLTTNWHNFEGQGEIISVAPTSASNYVFEAFDQCGNE
ncbi:MAG: choice-of-anchor L domain-containing protein, partial [Flavobacteriales bacterium]